MNNERPARLTPRGSSLVIRSTSSLVRPLDDATPGDQANQNDDDRDHEQQMDQPATDVKHAEAENPQNEENNGDVSKALSEPPL